MTEKNKRKAELKSRRNPPIPLPKRTKTRREKEIAVERKYRNPPSADD